MSQRGSSRALASAFAHLMPGHRAAKSETDPKAKGRRAEEDKPDEEDDDKPKGKKKAEEPDTDTGDDGAGVDGEAEPDLGDVEDPDDSLDDEDATPPGEDDSDPKVRKAATRARKAANARWSKVLGHRAAGGRVAAACVMLQSQPRASASSIIRTLAALPAAEAPQAAAAPPTGRARLDERMAARPSPQVGSDAGKPATPDGNFAAFAAATVKKVRG